MLQDTNFSTNVHVPDNNLQRALSLIVWILSQYHKSFHDGAQRYIYSLSRKPSRQDTDLIWIKLSDIRVCAVNRIKVNRVEQCNLIYILWIRRLFKDKVWKKLPYPDFNIKTCNIFWLLESIYLHLILYYQYIPFVLNHCIFFISLTENTHVTIMYDSVETWKLILIILEFFLFFTETVYVVFQHVLLCVRIHSSVASSALSP